MSIDRNEAIEDAAGFIGIEPDRMAHSLSLTDNGRKLAEQANDFLIRHGLQGSPLRNQIGGGDES